MFKFNLGDKVKVQILCFIKEGLVESRSLKECPNYSQRSYGVSVVGNPAWGTLDVTELFLQETQLKEVGDIVDDE